MWPDDSGSWDFGPQTDGTYNSPVIASQPTDAGGGAPANYGQTVLDVFKFGVGAWQQQQSQQSMLDYKRFEATQGALTQQGAASGTKVAVGGFRLSPAMLLIGAGVVAAILIARK